MIVARVFGVGVAVLSSVLPYTLELTLCAILIGLILGVPIGTITAVRRNTSTDYVGRIISLIGLSLPSFYLAVLLLGRDGEKVHRWLTDRHRDADLRREPHRFALRVEARTARLHPVKPSESPLDAYTTDLVARAVSDQRGPGDA